MDEKILHSLNNGKTGDKLVLIPENKRGKFTVASVDQRTVDGIIFDSKIEAERYKELRLLEKAGKIEKLEIQKKFVLIEEFMYKTQHIRGISYYADFYYLEVWQDLDSFDLLPVVEEWKVKVTKTKDYILKKKMFLQKYGEEIDFREMVKDEMRWL